LVSGGDVGAVVGGVDGLGVVVGVVHRVVGIIIVVVDIVVHGSQRGGSGTQGRGAHGVAVLRGGHTRGRTTATAAHLRLRSGTASVGFATGVSHIGALDLAGRAWTLFLRTRTARRTTTERVETLKHLRKVDVEVLVVHDVLVDVLVVGVGLRATFAAAKAALAALATTTTTTTTAAGALLELVLAAQTKGLRRDVQVLDILKVLVHGLVVGAVLGVVATGEALVGITILNAVLLPVGLVLNLDHGVSATATTGLGDLDLALITLGETALVVGRDVVGDAAAGTNVEGVLVLEVLGDGIVVAIAIVVALLEGTLLRTIFVLGRDIDVLLLLDVLINVAVEGILHTHALLDRVTHATLVMATAGADNVDDFVLILVVGLAAASASAAVLVLHVVVTAASATALGLAGTDNIDDVVLVLVVLVAVRRALLVTATTRTDDVNLFVLVFVRLVLRLALAQDDVGVLEVVDATLGTASSLALPEAAASGNDIDVLEIIFGAATSFTLAVSTGGTGRFLASPSAVV